MAEEKRMDLIYDISMIHISTRDTFIVRAIRNHNGTAEGLIYIQFI